MKIVRGRLPALTTLSCERSNAFFLVAVMLEAGGRKIVAMPGKTSSSNAAKLACACRASTTVLRHSGKE